MQPRVLVVDDEETIREELCEAIRDGGLLADGVGTGAEAVDRILMASYDVCISDIRMPEMDGIELLQKIRELSPETLVILMTAFGDMNTAIDAMRYGASDYVLKPLLFDDILAKVNRMVEHRHLQMEVRNLRRAVGPANSSQTMVGESPAMESIRDVIRKVAPTRCNVLIVGESGTGKELIARAIHDEGERPESPFVPINCAAIPEMLLESELFGHVKGAFTGATGNKEGLLRTAGDGTIFLDELGDMSMALQAKLLRATEQREIQPVGSVRRIPIEARIIGATHRDLKRRIDEELFREDLYYRLAVVEVEVPPLRDRQEDIPRLVQHFLDAFRAELGKECLGIENDALRLLMGYEWRGNIRELENTIERALILTDSDWIRVEDLPEGIRGARPADLPGLGDLHDAVQRFEQTFIGKAIDHCDGDKRAAAKVLGISLSSLYRKLENDPSRVG